MIARGKADARKLAHARVLLQADASEGGPEWTDKRTLAGAWLGSSRRAALLLVRKLPIAPFVKKMTSTIPCVRRKVVIAEVIDTKQFGPSLRRPFKRHASNKMLDRLGIPGARFRPSPLHWHCPASASR